MLLSDKRAVSRALQLQAVLGAHKIDGDDVACVTGIASMASIFAAAHAHIRGAWFHMP